jgi:hypothetical protein
MCSCGCNTCDTKKPIINETILKQGLLSEGLLYHVKTERPIYDNIYRYGSEKYLELFKEVRHLYSRNLIELNSTDVEVITETDLGEFGEYEGKVVPLDLILEEMPISEMKLIGQSVRDFLKKVISNKELIQKLGFKDEKGLAYFLKNADVNEFEDLRDELASLEASEPMTEAKKAEKKTPELNKPKRGGAKKFYVYVKDPKTKNIKKVSFGDTTGLSAKINNPKARKAFADRHDCKNKKDKTKAGYWACRLPRYAKLLGLKGSYSGFW